MTAVVVVVHVRLVEAPGVEEQATVAAPGCCCWNTCAGGTPWPKSWCSRQTSWTCCPDKGRA